MSLRTGRSPATAQRRRKLHGRLRLRPGRHHHGPAPSAPAARRTIQARLPQFTYGHKWPMIPASALQGWSLEDNAPAPPAAAPSSPSTAWSSSGAPWPNARERTGALPTATGTRKTGNQRRHPPPDSAPPDRPAPPCYRGWIPGAGIFTDEHRCVLSPARPPPTNRAPIRHPPLPNHPPPS